MRILTVFLAVAAVLLVGQVRIPGPGGATAGGGTVIDAGFDFRNTSGFVTDTSGNQFTDGTNYPVTNTISGVSMTYGWHASGSDANFLAGCNAVTTPLDRNSGVDARLAGIVVISGSDCSAFSVLLPNSGTYDVFLAAGDNNSGQGPMSYAIYDKSSLVTTLVSGVSTSAAQWYDAGGNLRTSAANWVSSGSTTSVTVTMSTVYLTLKMTSTGSATISYFRVKTH